MIVRASCYSQVLDISKAAFAMKLTLVALGLLASTSLALPSDQFPAIEPPALLNLGYATYEGQYNASYDVSCAMQLQHPLTHIARSTSSRTFALQLLL
jgi:hypothetical protein